MRLAMKSFVNALLRAVCALIVGVLLVKDPISMTTVIVRFIGGVFVFLGLVQTISALADQRSQGALQHAFLPFAGMGSILLGVLLLIMPATFVSFLMYILGFMLVFLGFGQIVTLISNRQVVPLRWWVFVVPVLLLGAGLFILLKPLTSASLPFIILGVGCLAYGVSELYYALRAIHYERQKRKEYVDFELIDETDDSFEGSAGEPPLRSTDI